MSKITYLLVNFGGPRDLNEIEEFLIELLTDQEVIRTSFPAVLHRLLFTQVAKKRAKKIAPDYALIGGKSPIFDDTEAIARNVGAILGEELMTFHRYLPKTHDALIKKMEQLNTEEIRVVPLFPHFSYATTGSIALWFSKHLTLPVINKLSWVKSYAEHPGYLNVLERSIRDFLNQHSIEEEESILLFSAHGLPQRFICTGDIYEKESMASFESLKKRFPKAICRLSYQSQFGREEWIRPYTNEICAEIDQWGQGRKKAVIIPLSFTSDHIETLYEIEQLYLSKIREKKVEAFRCPALNLRSDWMNVLAELFLTKDRLTNQMLIRKETGRCCKNSADCKLKTIHCSI